MTALFLCDSLSYARHTRGIRKASFELVVVTLSYFERSLYYVSMRRFSTLLNLRML